MDQLIPVQPVFDRDELSVLPGTTAFLELTPAQGGQTAKVVFRNARANRQAEAAFEGVLPSDTCLRRPNMPLCMQDEGDRVVFLVRVGFKIYEASMLLTDLKPFVFIPEPEMNGEVDEAELEAPLKERVLR